MKKLIIIVSIILLFTSSVYYVGEKALMGGIGPDSPWYFVDSWVENIRLHYLTFNESKKIELRLQMMEERLAELRDLERLKKLTNKNVEKIKQKYDILAQDLTEAIDQKIQDAKDEQKRKILEKIKATTQKQKESLIKIWEQAPKPVQSILDDVLTITKDAYNRASDILEAD